MFRSGSLKQTIKALGKLGALGSIGFVVGVALLLSFLGGREVDRWLHTDPFFTILSLLLAFSGLTVWFYQLTSDLRNDNQPEEDES